MRRPRGDASGANRTRADRARLPGRVREPRRAAETIRARSDERNVTRRGARDGSNDIDIDIDDDDDDARYGTYGRRRRVGQRRTAVRRVETRLHAGVRSPEGSSAIRLFSLRGKGRGMLCEVDATMCHTTVRRFAASSPLRVLLRPRLRLRLRRSEFFEAILIPLGYPPLRHLALAVRHLGPVHDAGEGTVFVHCARSIGVVRRMNEEHAREGKGAHRNPRSGAWDGDGRDGDKGAPTTGPIASIATVPPLLTSSLGMLSPALASGAGRPSPPVATCRITGCRWSVASALGVSFGKVRFVRPRAPAPRHPGPGLEGGTCPCPPSSDSCWTAPSRPSRARGVTRGTSTSRGRNAFGRERTFLHFPRRKHRYRFKSDARIRRAARESPLVNLHGIG